MDKEIYFKEVKNLHRGDLIFVHVKPEYAEKAGVNGILGTLIQYGTGEFAHVETYYGNKDGNHRTILEANGNKVAWNSLDRYLAHAKAFRLVFKRLRDVNVDDIKAMETEMYRQVGVEYDKGQLVGLGIKSALTKIPILGFFINKFIWSVPTPFASKEKLICSESAALICMAPKNPDGKPKYGSICQDNVTPSSLARNPLLRTIGEVG